MILADNKTMEVHALYSPAVRYDIAKREDNLGMLDLSDFGKAVERYSSVRVHTELTGMRGNASSSVCSSVSAARAFLRRVFMYEPPCCCGRTPRTPPPLMHGCTMLDGASRAVDVRLRAARMLCSGPRTTPWHS